MRIGRGADKRHAELTRRAGAAPGLQSEGAPTHGARPRASERLHEVPGAATLVQTASVGVPGPGGAAWLFTEHRVSARGDGEIGRTMAGVPNCALSASRVST